MVRLLAHVRYEIGGGRCACCVPSLVARTGRLVSSTPGATMSTTRYSVILRDTGGALRKLARYVIGSDGSYYVTCPYHESGKVYLSKRTMSFADGAKHADTEPVELALLDDDERRLKLTHHPDGWVQFSGKGIVS